MNAKRMVPGALFLAALGVAFLAACSSNDDSPAAQNGPITCGASQTMCNDACVDVATDQNNCGDCGTVCADGQVCVDGECAASCAGGYAACGGKCVNAQYDVANCGGCGKKCGSGQVCDRGECGVGCGAGASLCGDTGSAFCADTNNDRANCGGCGVKCATGEICNVGVCASSCTAPLTVCGGACVDTANDPAHCGGCTKPACPAQANASAVCASGECGSVCQSGFADCDGKADTGCETPVDTVSNCGGCGTTCSVVPANATPACVSAACGFECTPGFVKNTAGDGCEAQVAFPSEGSIETCSGAIYPVDGGAACFVSGDTLEQTFAYSSTASVTGLDIDFTMADQTDGCATEQTLEWDVLVNGVLVGSYSFPGGSGVTPRAITASYSFGPISADASGNFTLRFQSGTTVCAGGGALGWIAGGSAVLR